MKSLLRTHVALGVLSLMCCNILLSQNQGSDSKLDSVEAQKWSADVRFLVEQLPRRHKNLFHSMTKEQFEISVGQLFEGIPALSRHQIIVELARIGAMIGDGHSGIRPLRDPKLNFRCYPIKLYYFRDGIFIQSAPESLRSIVGGKVTKIDETSVDDVYKGVAALVPRDNDMTLRNLAPFLLSQPEALNSLGFVRDMESTTFTIEKNGKSQTIALRPMPYGSTVGFTRNSGWVDARDEAKDATPLWLKYPDNLFWFEYLNDTKTLYIQLNAVANKPSANGTPRETVEDFFRTVFEFADSHPLHRFVLDLRMNGGGSSELNKPILHGLIRSAKINQKGKLFVIIGRRTFSAAQNLVNELEQHTEAMFVGEPTGGRPNHYGDAMRITLPNSGIAFHVSTLWHQEAGARDTRSWTTPYLAAELTSEEYRRNIDPAMTLILSYTYEPSKEMPELLLNPVMAHQYSNAERALREYLDDPVRAYVNVENQVNSLGYKLLNSGRTDEAIELFKVNAKMYPHSSNVYDSLGEAYLKAEKKEMAIQNYMKSLELDPTNANAVNALNRLKLK